MEPLSDAEIEEVANAADDLGERVVDALVAKTDRDPDVFDIDPGEYEFLEPDGDYLRGLKLDSN